MYVYPGKHKHKRPVHQEVICNMLLYSSAWVLNRKRKETSTSPPGHFEVLDSGLPALHHVLAY